jgi:hypothetical protein
MYAPPAKRVPDTVSPFTLERIFAHELGHAAMGNLDNGPGRMNNVNWNENPVMRQLGDFNDRTAY